MTLSFSFIDQRYMYIDLPEAVIVLTMTALNPFTGTVLSSVSGATGDPGDGVTGRRCEDAGMGMGGATVAAETDQRESNETYTYMYTHVCISLLKTLA